MDYMLKPPTEMQDVAMQTGMTPMQQAVPVQAPFAAEMRPFENARGAAPEQMIPKITAADLIQELNYRMARKHLETLRSGLSNPPRESDIYNWVDAHIMGGWDTFSGKRNVDGSLKKDMEDKVYYWLIRRTLSFYRTAMELPYGVQRERELTLYRGIRIPKVEEGASDEEIETIISRYGDVIPSSASWDMETPLEFSRPYEKGQDAVILHMIVPPEFPLVMISYPKAARKRDSRPLSHRQQEVIVGASTFSDVHLLEKEEMERYRRYHVEVRLNEVEYNDVISAIQAARSQKNSISASEGSEKEQAFL